MSDSQIKTNPEYEIFHKYLKLAQVKDVSSSYCILRDEINDDKNEILSSNANKKKDVAYVNELQIDDQINKMKPFEKIIGQSEKIKKLKREIFYIKDKKCKVLISGESGTGKSLIAHIIHEISPLKDKHLVSVNVGALQKDLIESTLFGSVKGAFTDAVDRKGLISLADGGTLFLDEIAELPYSCQAHLLRVIEEGIFRKVGSNAEEKVNCRFICATNQNLKELVRKKLFREDLYYRIAEFCINVPSLKERRDDILVLAEYFLNSANSKSSHEKKYFTKESKEKLLDYSWPGNIRELRTAVNVSTIYSQGTKIIPSDIQFI